VRDTGPRHGAPTVMLLHGLGATAAINWPGAVESLSAGFRVVTLDLRGHGRGVRSVWPFRLEDAADDLAHLADALGVERFIAAGYSMGGAVALLARRRHPQRVSGLVLCATAARFAGDDGGGRPSPFGVAMAATLRLTPSVVRRHMSRAMISYLGRETAMSPTFRAEAQRHDPAAVLEASNAVRSFDARPWLGELGCPAASVITERDRWVPAARQRELAHAVGASIHPLPADHDIALRDPAGFLPTLSSACHTVARRTSLQHTA
jgi:pimeloyl-ACP methyl ester carboxylesterase